MSDHWPYSLNLAYAAGPVLNLVALSAAFGRWMIAAAGFAMGLIAFGLLAVIEYGAWTLVVPPRPRQTKSPVPTDDDWRPIQAVAPDGARLTGRFCARVSDSPGEHTAIVIHGFAEAADSLREVRASILRRFGWQPAIIDLRGYGGSDGPFASFGGREAADVSTWLDLLETTSRTGRKPVFLLWGRSMGAAIALRAATMDPRVQGLILESPMLDLDDALAAWFRKRRFLLPRLMARLVTERASRIAGVSLRRPRAAELAPSVRCPVLILHGRNDTLVSPEQVRRFTRAFPNPPQLVEAPGAGHSDVLEIGGASVVDQIGRFLTDSRLT